MSNFLINPYNFVVAVDLCQLESSDYAMSGYTNTRERVGVKLQSGSTWIGKEIDAVKFWLMWNGSGSGTTYGRVYRDGTTDPIITFGSKAIETMNTGSGGACSGGCNWEEVTFTGGGNYTLLENDIICVVNDNSSPTTLYTDPYFLGEPNNLVQMRYDGSSWETKAGESLKLCIEEA